MALWQFSITFVPRRSAKVANLDAIWLSIDTLESLPLGLTGQNAERLVAGFAALLPERSPWAAGMRVWGDALSDDAEVYFDADGGVEVAIVRFDASRISLAVIEGVCGLARSLDCVFATDDGAIIQPRSENVIRVLTQSHAMAFAKDPRLCKRLN